MFPKFHRLTFKSTGPRTAVAGLFDLVSRSRWTQLKTKIRFNQIRYIRVDPRKFENISLMTVAEFQDLYNSTKENIYETSDSVSDVKVINKHAVFANNDLSLRYIDVYGFDYDYTLANYSEELHHAIYRMAVDNLITFGYPEEIKFMKFDNGFPIRGLHFDIRKGLLMKLDSFTHIQLGTVYRGRTPVPDLDVVNLYRGTHLGIDQINRGVKTDTGYIRQLIDLFSIPFMGLLSNVIEYFVSNNIPYDPEYIYYDCEHATQKVHYSGAMYKTIEENLETFLPRDSACIGYINKLKDAGKKMFLITNSKYSFVNKGMNHLIGTDWKDLFDVIITNARKPEFFNDIHKPFRTVDSSTGYPQWDQVSRFQPHHVYSEGNIQQFTRFSEWEGPNVLYFGDHVYSDLMDPVLRHGWRTAAIIPELEREIAISNSLEYRHDVQWLQALEDLSSMIQIHNGKEAKDVFYEWKNERNEIRKKTKTVFNAQFGSVFRTYTNPSYFSRRLTRYADIYMSTLDNLESYPLDFTFYPIRNALPHEINYDRYF